MLNHNHEAEILSLAIDGQLPDPIDGSSVVDVSYVRELIEAGLLKGINVTTMDGGPAYAQVRITYPGRQRLNALGGHQQGLASRLENVLKPVLIEAASMTAPTQTKGTAHVRVFVSHRSDDKSLASALHNFLRTALKLSGADIRCTSVSGSKLSGGAEVSRNLRREAVESDAFVALLTPSSINSVFTLLEIGARWGTEKRIILLLANGLKPTEVQPPLKDFHLLSAIDPSDLHDLVGLVADALGIAPEKPGAYQDALDNLIGVAAPERKKNAIPPQVAEREPLHLSDDQLKILWEMGRTYRGPQDRFLDANIQAGTLLTPLKFANLMANLQENDLVGVVISPSPWREYFLMDKGLAVASELCDYSHDDFAVALAGWRAHHS